MIESRELLIESFIAEVKVKMENKMQRVIPPEEYEEEFAEQVRGILAAFNMPPVNTIEHLRQYMQTLLGLYQQMNII